MRKNGITDNYQPSFDQMSTPTKNHAVNLKIYPTVLYRKLDSDIACSELSDLAYLKKLHIFEMV